jgi:hypothetical protein
MKFAGASKVSDVKKKLIKFLLPWIATIISALPYSDQRSLFLDRLLDFVEN